MGEVYRARDTRLGREVAIKTLAASLGDDPQRLGRLRRDAEALAALVYVCSFSGSGGRSPVSTDGGEMPDWAKDGRRLFYVHQQVNLMTVEFPGGPASSGSTPSLLATSDILASPGRVRTSATSRTVDVARDGRFLVTRAFERIARVEGVRLILTFDRNIRRRIAPVGAGP
jgi:hypothetical protein